MSSKSAQFYDTLYAAKDYAGAAMFLNEIIEASPRISTSGRGRRARSSTSATLESRRRAPPAREKRDAGTDGEVRSRCASRRTKTRPGATTASGPLAVRVESNLDRRSIAHGERGSAEAQHAPTTTRHGLNRRIRFHRPRAPARAWRRLRPIRAFTSARVVWSRIRAVASRTTFIASRTPQVCSSTHSAHFM